MVLMSRVTTQVNAMNKVLINKSRGELLGIIDSICVFRLLIQKRAEFSHFNANCNVEHQNYYLKRDDT